MIKASHNQIQSRRGTIVPMLALGLVALLGTIALATDIGVIAVARIQAQDAADIAALAGARTLNGDSSSNYNLSGSVTSAQGAAANNVILGQQIVNSNVSIQTGVYSYNSTSQSFSASNMTSGTSASAPSAGSWTATQATINASLPTYFARVFGVNSFNVTSTATAVHRPRDVAIILDFSGSMKFATTANWPSSNGDGVRSLNPDPSWPQFGHYSRYVGLATDGTNPMQRTTDYTMSSGEINAVNNYTMASDSGPALAGSSSAQCWVTNSSGSYVSAFNNPQGSSWSASNTPTCTPAPDNFKDQTDSPVTYNGDKWPRVGLATSGSWAHHVQEALNNGTTYSSNTHARDDAWEWKGYDKSNANWNTSPTFKGYSMGPAYYGKTFWNWPPDPRYGTAIQFGATGKWYYDNSGANAANPDSPSATNPAMDTNGKWLADWRSRFFYFGSSHARSGQRVDDNSVLFDSSGNFNTPSNSGYQVDYSAILKWISTGPQVFPPNLRSGRVLYYSAIPTDVTSSTNLDQVFWKKYIDYVLGIQGGSSVFHGKDTTAWGTGKITARSSLVSSGVRAGSPSGTNPAPYMQYQDNPDRPRAHWWFGPYTMMMFICDDGPAGNMSPGTCTEAQCWQLKAGVQSALDDIKNNHPNDWVALIYFSDKSAFNTPRVQLGQNYTKMKNALWYPFSLLNVLGDTSQELRAIDSSFNWQLGGDVPHAEGGTCPDMGFKLAYNEFSMASGYNGRKGAAKMVILETDGVPNTTCGGTLSNSGAYLSTYGSASSLGSTNYTSNGDNATESACLATVTQITNQDNSSGKGFSTTKMPARVHAIAFGDLFETSTTTKQDALDFLTSLEINGKTLPSGSTSIESYKIIIGDYNTRIANLRTAFERIMQGGVQVTLIQ